LSTESSLDPLAAVFFVYRQDNRECEEQIKKWKSVLENRIKNPHVVKTIIGNFQGVTKDPQDVVNLSTFSSNFQAGFFD